MAKAPAAVWSRGAFGQWVLHAACGLGPLHDVGTTPEGAHRQPSLWSGEVLALDELLHALTGDAEHLPDLLRAHPFAAHEEKSKGCLLTRGIDTRNSSHVTSLVTRPLVKKLGDGTYQARQERL